MNLREELVTRAARVSAPGDPADTGSLMALLRLLYDAGRIDLPLARLLEGHVDATQIVHRYGDDAQRSRLATAGRSGALLGVWNAALAGEPLRESDGRLSGGKSFASGAGVISHALVTAETPDGPQLILLDLESVPPAIDREVWHVVGMQRSETHVVRWSDAALDPGDLIGKPGDYVREPWFSGGALRFAAVQAGGIAALVDWVRDHLVAVDRADDPHQLGRLAALHAAAEAAAGAVRTAAHAWFADEGARLPLVSAARCAVYAAGDTALTLAQQAVGLQAMFVHHPLAATITDLSVYLRQPGPDAQRMRVGRAVADGVIVPTL
ncbi:acyl-CoA dehydrogenase family protein [Sphingomonas yantingensis]|uniref:Alkylation response protein AidB-like acyl-CoA dehydrogenase n=2 Tax=Sphingomonas TaxID=13687 RepID=A0A7W9ASE4_9SPHN|nr:acyl-CoA dehydrogenase family protein [Sphingomonas yantingensis]MBB5699707.1 alkylation response protein AidB-like acyl-CoA dehydrogenase [Sphingomonas yantingensis]